MERKDGNAAEQCAASRLESLIARKKESRKRQLEQMTREQIIAEWRKATKSTDPSPRKPVRTLIDETLAAE